MPSVLSASALKSAARQSRADPDEALLRALADLSAHRLAHRECRTALDALRAILRDAAAEQTPAVDTVGRMLSELSSRCPGVFSRMAALSVAEAMVRAEFSPKRAAARKR